MRNAFARAMTELAQERSDVCLLSGDIGNRMFDRYKEVAPARFLNCGIAEANMMSMAAGMALSGLRPVVYTITPFTTTRCLSLAYPLAVSFWLYFKRTYVQPHTYIYIHRYVHIFTMISIK